MSAITIVLLLIALVAFVLLGTCSWWVWKLRTFNRLRVINDTLKNDNIDITVGSLTVHQLCGLNYIGPKVSLYYHVMNTVTALVNSTVRDTFGHFIFIIGIAIVALAIFRGNYDAADSEIYARVAESIFLISEFFFLFLFYIRLSNVKEQVDRYDQIIDDYIRTGNGKREGINGA